ncbi:hypothetical protein HELRODRAFT_97267 [Helobdella robusta]|uniref:Histone-lysine N-methyltransferase n=1 Tax=Helobdella robusta TaxID=6412 RepID=T1G9G3_HELRO|nr:hypothetical protein HELRODRAFT_97267 [Helobdella robusta]ESO09953.1 hypothetical protein HELRODRAFT_97267 [Helobdella robusta]
MLCGSSGDAESNGPGRLLDMHAAVWVHCNCSLWSHDVYETLDGTLVGSKRHINSMKHTGFCAVCARPGATVACFLPSCGQSFHLICARKQGMCFLENKTTYCKHHCPRHLLGTMIHDLSIKRRICCERNEIKQVARMLKEDEPENYFIRIGSLLVNNIGHLLPQHVQTFKFNTDVNIYPVGFKSTRFYWSYRNLHQRCQYHCSIEECSGEPLFKVKVVEHGEENVTFESNTCTGAWKDILDHLVELRRRHGLAHLFRQYITGEDLFGLNEPAIRKVIESLPGVELMTNVQMRYGKSSIYVLPLAVNPSGCVRTEPKSRTFFKRFPSASHNFNAGGSSEKSTWMGSGEFSITQYMKQFTATKSQRYRSLRTEWRNNVYLRRSNIQGLGLFAARELEQFTMVIEYIGEIIRNEIAEIREKVYEQQNRGVYMFRLDENKVVDATMAGGPARYINHSCDPNCFTEVVATEKGEKIIIIAKRKIRSGEELSYDYKFNFEDEKSKIPCLCGAAKCMKWMN